jgi:L-amino acid N-acyltransferase
MVTVRQATSDDVPAITEIYNALLDSTTYEWTETLYVVEERARWLRQKQLAGHPVLVATDGDDVIGVASYGDFRDSTRWPGYRFTIEHSVHVAHGHWGRGIGRALMAGLGAHARRSNKRVMVAGIDASNTTSIRFHSRLGFDEVARMPGVGEKWGRRLDLVLMQRDLDDVDW